MATITTHVLNGADGTHAGAVPVKLVNSDTGDILIESSTNAEGRFRETVNLKGADAKARYELVIETQQYWTDRGMASDLLIDEIVLRFSMPDIDALYHKPVIMAPYSYSVWSSVAE